MKQLFLQSRNITLLIVVFLAFNSCRVTFVPNYDSKISEQIDETTKRVDFFYLEMLDNTKNDDGSRAYANFSEKYIQIEVELNSLLNKNKVRPLNDSSIRICEITLQLWRKYKGVHKTDNTLSNGEIIYNQRVFNDLFYAMQVAEKGKLLAETPPQ